MDSDRIDERRVDAAFENIRRLRASAWSLSVAEAAALAERTRVEIIIDKTMSASQKRWYRAYSDYLDAVVDERMDKEGLVRDRFHDRILNYLRAILEED